LQLISGDKVFKYTGARSAAAMIEFAKGGYVEGEGKPLPNLKFEKPVESASKVVVLDDESFNQKVNGQDPWFIEFYAPWCGHCKSLAPTWDALADKAEGTGISIANVDATVNRGVANRYNIRGFPTLVFIKGGKVYEYSGGRNADDLLAFAEGAYEEVDSTDFPVPSAPMHPLVEQALQLLKPLLEDFKHIYNVRKNAAVVFFLGGMLFGMLFCSCCCGSCCCGSKPQKKSKKE
jgi:protein disulfide-isomerase-like protein